MAEDSAAEKTEEPSDKRVEEFRSEGKVARTVELTSSVAIITALLMISILGPQLGQQFAASLKVVLTMPPTDPLHAFDSWVSMFGAPAMKTTVIFVITLFCAVAATSLAQTGLLFSWKALKPDTSHINPMSGLKKIFSMQTLVNFTKNFLKMVVIGFIVYMEVKNKLVTIVNLTHLPITDSVGWTLGLLGIIVMKICIFLAIVAIADYFYNWWTMHNKMKMSRQELKDEMKESQLPEHVRSKVRQIANERAKRKNQKEVPKADVVITNPTHFSVALKYDRLKDKAPRVVAKGHDLMAKQIREIATKNNVPLYEYPVLARSLYKQVKVGHMIPYELFEAVAKVLAFIYRLHRDRYKLRA